MAKETVRSGRRVLGVIEQVADGCYTWACRRTGDSGITDAGRDGAIDRILVQHWGSGTAAGIRRQYEITVQ